MWNINRPMRASTWEISFFLSQNSCSFIDLSSSNDMLNWNMRVSSSWIVIFLEFHSLSLYFTQISSKFHMNFWIISFSFLKFPWNSLTFGIPWKIPWGAQNSLDFAKPRIIPWKWKPCASTVYLWTCFLWQCTSECSTIATSEISI